jgi:hypothetical protein
VVVAIASLSLAGTVEGGVAVVAIASLSLSLVQ